MDSMGREQDSEPRCQMMLSVLLGLLILWRAVRRKQRRSVPHRLPDTRHLVARRMAGGWWKSPPPYDPAWRAGIDGTPVLRLVSACRRGFRRMYLRAEAGELSLRRTSTASHEKHIRALLLMRCDQLAGGRRERQQDANP
jgi:hypothetical protein